MFAPEKLLPQLIALPSVNPAFLPVGDHYAGEQRVADFLFSTLRSAGLDVSKQEVAIGRYNVLGRYRRASKPSHSILLVPHLDTVNGTEEQFSPKKKGGRLFGRGACDTKGSVAAMVCALCNLAQLTQGPAQTEIIFAGLVDEENAQAGSRHLAASGLKADLAIVGEPTRLLVVTAHKGSLWLKYETHGKSAHGAKPELGRNAVHEMSRIVNLLETEYAHNLRTRTHALLGSPTVNVGVIAGGTQPNIVPDQCWIEIDRRTLPGETEGSVDREIKALLSRRGLRAISSSSKTAPCWPMETDPGNPMVHLFFAALKQKRPAGVDYFCDAGILSQAGIPSVVFGPGDIAQAHTNNEWISLRSLARATEMLLRFLKSLP